MFLYVHIELIFNFFIFLLQFTTLHVLYYTLSVTYSGIFIYVFEIVNEKKIFII